MSLDIRAELEALAADIAAGVKTFFSNSIGSHNTNASAHADIRALLPQKVLYEQEFSEDSWIIFQDDVTEVEVPGGCAAGAGGGIGGGRPNVNSWNGGGGGGGQEGQSVQNLKLAVIPGTRYMIQIGKGGTGGVGGTIQMSGKDGGDTTLGTVLVLKGGVGGGAGQSGTTTTWGIGGVGLGNAENGGTPSASTNNGGDGGKGGDSLFGTGGARVAGTNGAGVPGNDATEHGAGGSGGSGRGIITGTGTYGGIGGNGTDGFLKLRWWSALPPVVIRDAWQYYLMMAR